MAKQARIGKGESVLLYCILRRRWRARQCVAIVEPGGEVSVAAAC
jgi:hypothetical protein